MPVGGIFLRAERQKRFGKRRYAHHEKGFQDTICSRKRKCFEINY